MTSDPQRPLGRFVRALRLLAVVASRVAGRTADLIDRIDMLSAYLAAVGLAAMSGIVFWEVLIRSLFTRSTLIADEIASYMLAMLSFFALGYTLRTGAHIRVTLFFHLFSAKARKWIDAAFVLIALVALSFLTLWLIELVVQSYVTKIDSQSQIETPLWIPQSALVYGTVVLGLALVSRLIRLLKNELEP